MLEFCPNTGKKYPEEAVLGEICPYCGEPMKDHYKAAGSETYGKGEISDSLRNFIETIVKEVFIEGKPFDDNRKKGLQLFCGEGGGNYVVLEKNLSDFFKAMEDWDMQKSKSSQLTAVKLARACGLDDSWVDKLTSMKKETKE